MKKNRQLYHIAYTVKKDQKMQITLIGLLLFAVFPIVTNLIIRFLPNIFYTFGEYKDWLTFWGSYAGSAFSAVLTFVLIQRQFKDAKEQEKRHQTEIKRQEDRHKKNLEIQAKLLAQSDAKGQIELINYMFQDAANCINITKLTYTRTSVRGFEVEDFTGVEAFRKAAINFRPQSENTYNTQNLVLVPNSPITIQIFKVNNILSNLIDHIQASSPNEQVKFYCASKCLNFTSEGWYKEYIEIILFYENELRKNDKKNEEFFNSIKNYRDLIDKIARM